MPLRSRRNVLVFSAFGTKPALQAQAAFPTRAAPGSFSWRLARKLRHKDRVPIPVVSPLLPRDRKSSRRVACVGCVGRVRS
jgi:hypothetical protein